MIIWFPEYIKKLQIDSYNRKSTNYTDLDILRATFNYTLENTIFENDHFREVEFINITLNHCVFKNCTFSNCTFRDVRSSKSFFRYSVFNHVLFNHTDFYDYRFDDCIISSSNFTNTEPGCKEDFDINFLLSDIFFQSLIAQLAIIPGNIVSSYILDSLGRVRTMGLSLFLTGVSAFFIWFLDTKVAVTIFQAVFNFISISGWNAVDVLTTESYPAPLRSTGYGFLSSMSRLGAILGNVTFGAFIGVSKAVPILTAAAVLLIAGICSVKLPETKDNLM